MRGVEAVFESSPSGPMTTARRSSGPATMANTTSRSARSDGVATILAPNSVSGSAFAAVRL